MNECDTGQLQTSNNYGKIQFADLQIHKTDE